MSNQESLYEKLGAMEGISKIVDDIIAAHMVNPGIKARYLPLKDDDKHFKEVRQHLIDFLAAGSGGPVEYKGKDMVSAHRGMNISQGEYMDVVDDIMAALEKNKIDEQTQKDVLAIAYSLKNQMIRI